MNPATPLPSVHQELAAALQQRRAVIADRAASERDAQAHMRQLQDVSEKIIALQTRLPAPVDPRLAHYLERCSYDKALAFLQDQFSTE